MGALAPLVGWLINKRWPKSIFKYVKWVQIFFGDVAIPNISYSFSIPVVLAGTGWMPPATAVNYIPWALIGFIFNYVIRKRHFNWWAKYNCEYRRWFTLPAFPIIDASPLFVDVLSAALDCGTAIGTLIVFFVWDWYTFPWLCWQASLFFKSLQYPRRGTIGENTIESWWGNTVYLKTADQQALPLRKVVPGEFFGSVVNCP